jgi:hypothetical protein
MSRAVDLGAQKSLLIPFLREPVGVERVTVFESSDAAGQASIVLDNTSSQTLPPGTLALFEGGGFAGESATERVEPGQRRVLPFGIDLDVHLKAETGSSRRELHFLTYEGGRVQQHYLRHQNVQYTIENRGARERAVHVVLDTVNNATVTGSDDVFVDDALGRIHAVFRIGATQRKGYAVKLEEGLSESLAIAKLDSARVRRWLLQKALPRARRTCCERCSFHSRSTRAP